MPFEPPPPNFARFFAPTYRQLVPGFVGALRPGVVPTSWWRSPMENRRVGGAPESQHLFGFAADFDAPRDRRQLLTIADDLRRAGFVTVVEFDHVHAQAFPPGALRRAGFF